MTTLPHIPERSHSDAFIAREANLRLRDQRDLMEQPFFSLAKGKRTAPILYKAGDVEVQVSGTPEHGIATIWDADILIWATSQIVAAENRGLTTSRRLRFMPYQLLTALGRATGATEYRLLKSALTRLQSTAITTTIRNGEDWCRHQFSWINKWTEIKTRSGRNAGIECILPDWFYLGARDHSAVLTVDPAYFQLKGGIERWLYRIARKHAGRQWKGWTFNIRHLHAKSGSLARFSDFAFDIRRIVERQSLPGYRLTIQCRDGQECLHIAPIKLSTDPVDNPVNHLVISGVENVDSPVISGLKAHDIGLSDSGNSKSTSTSFAPLTYLTYIESNCSRAATAGENPLNAPGITNRSQVSELSPQAPDLQGQRGPGNE